MLLSNYYVSLPKFNIFLCLHVSQLSRILLLIYICLGYVQSLLVKALRGHLKFFILFLIILSLLVLLTHTASIKQNRDWINLSTLKSITICQVWFVSMLIIHKTYFVINHNQENRLTFINIQAFDCSSFRVKSIYPGKR